jgi:hypothetical protein
VQLILATARPPPGTWRPIFAPSILASFCRRTPNFRISTLKWPKQAYFNIASRQSERKRKATVAFRDRLTAPTASAPKLTSRTARNKPQTALKPVAVKPLPELDHNHLPKLPKYEPPLNLRLLPSESIATGLSKLETFQQLYT